MTGYLKHTELCAWRFGGKCDCAERVTRVEGAPAIGDTITFRRSPDVADDTRAAFYDGAKATVTGISDDPLLPYALRFEDGTTIVAAGEEVERS